MFCLCVEVQSKDMARLIGAELPVCVCVRVLVCPVMDPYSAWDVYLPHFLFLPGLGL